MAGKYKLDDGAVSAIIGGSHGDPFAVLGMHEAGKNWIVRAFVPDAGTLEVTGLDGKSYGAIERRNDAGFFEGLIKTKDRQPLRYECANSGGRWHVTDPYSFGPVLGPMDDYYTAQGTHLRLYDKMGAHIISHEGATGVHFAVWAPNAQRVSVIGDFNHWDGRRHVMRKRAGTGVWEIFIPDMGEEANYKFEIVGAHGNRLPLKSDPYGFHSEMRPKTASRVARTDVFEWTDGDYLKARAERDPRRSPMSIYEVHLGSWRKSGDGGFLSYDELAQSLIPYVK